MTSAEAVTRVSRLLYHETALTLWCIWIDQYRLQPKCCQQWVQRWIARSVPAEHRCNPTLQCFRRGEQSSKRRCTSVVLPVGSRSNSRAQRIAKQQCNSDLHQSNHDGNASCVRGQACSETGLVGVDNFDTFAQRGIYLDMTVSR